MPKDDIQSGRALYPVHWAQRDDLIWFKELGYGYYHIRQMAPYDQAYFDKYKGYARTDLGAKLTKLRMDLVNSYVPKGIPIVDIGIGSGQFINEMSDHRPCYGYDVNPVAIEYLKKGNGFFDPYTGYPTVLTFWDSFEHIKDLYKIIERNAKFLFMSLPLFRDAAHVVNSKHYRKDEHYWYFTNWGLIRAMDEYGYQLAEFNDDETRSGREDIGTFVFIRR